MFYEIITFKKGAAINLVSTVSSIAESTLNDLECKFTDVAYPLVKYIFSRLFNDWAGSWYPVGKLARCSEFDCLPVLEAIPSPEI